MTKNKELYKKAFQVIQKDEGEIINIISTQFDEGEIFMSQKRDELTTNFELYKNTYEIKDKLNTPLEDQIGDETTFATVNALIARSISEDFKGEFVCSDARTQIIADNLNNMLTQDYDDNMLAVDLYGLLYKYIMGVYIKICIGWDGIKKTPIFNYVDPRSAIFDPNGDYATGQYNYFGINTLIGEFAIDTERLGYELLVPISGLGETTLMKNQDQSTSGFTNMGEGENNKYYDIYYHFFYTKNKKGENIKAMAILGNQRTLLLKIEVIDKISDDIDTEFPISFEYYGFEPNNPLGDNVVKHTAEPQKIKALNRQLRVKKSKASLYPMYFYNQRYLTKKDLAFGFNKFIPVTTKEDGPIDLKSIITAFRPEANNDASYLIDQELDRQVERATSIGANTQGSTIEGVEKATEISIIQGNTDVNISYREKVANIGKKQFMKVWYQAYLHNWEAGDKKILLVDDGMGVTPIEVRKKDFYLKSYSRIIIRSKTQVETQRRKDLQGINALVSLVASMPNIDDYQKLLLLRDMAEAYGMNKSKIKTRLHGGPEEELIKLENEILDSGQFFPISPDDNHYMHILLQKPVNMNEASIVHFQSHITKWIESGKQIQSSQNGTLQGIQSSMASANQAQLSQGNTPSNPNIS